MPESGQTGNRATAPQTDSRPPTCFHWIEPFSQEGGADPLSSANSKLLRSASNAARYYSSDLAEYYNALFQGMHSVIDALEYKNRLDRFVHDPNSGVKSPLTGRLNRLKPLEHYKTLNDLHLIRRESSKSRSSSPSDDPSVKRACYLALFQSCLADQ